jgi:cephalosporin hydroxylase
VNVTFGDSHKTIVPFFEARPNLKCDIVSVDGDHSFSGVTTDLEQLEPHLRSGGLIFVDDCNARDRIKGARSARAMFEAYASYLTTRGQAARSAATALAGILRVEYCPANNNGFCVASKGQCQPVLEGWLRVL